MTKRLFIDLETTGLDNKNDQIIQFGYIYKVGKVIKKRGLIKVEIGENIYPEMIKLLNTLVDRFNKEDKMYFLAYNAHFDTDFMRELFLKNGNKFFGAYFYTPSIDIMQIVADRMMSNKVRPENFKLSTICKYYKIPVVENKLHNADYDIDITHQLYTKLKAKKKN